MPLVMKIAKFSSINSTILSYIVTFFQNNARELNIYELSIILQFEMQ